ncbi:MAG TPA: serine hydrolase [Opitutaceae bacterium]|nr:serine hydrolase [Opitutaceae bacterium]
MQRALSFVFAATAALATAADLPRDSRFEAAAEFSRQHGGIAMLVQIDGRVVFEDYPNNGAVTRATELASGTKSFSGVLALCAVEDGLLSLDEKVSATINEWAEDPGRRDITIRQLLSLSSGIPGGDSALKTGRVPTYAEAIAVQAVAAPGEKFSYGPQPFQVFGEVLRRKLAQRDDTVMSYYERKIFRPLGIRPASWRKDANGLPNIPSGAALTARDWAKFGEMVRLDGKGVLPPGKIQECFRSTKANPGYGLTWWLPAAGPLGGAVPRKIAGAWLPKDTWMAAGAGGQRLVVVPSLNLVAVRKAPVRGDEAGFNDRVWLKALVDGLGAKAE